MLLPLTIFDNLHKSAYTPQLMEEKQTPLSWQLITFAIVRTLINTALRMVYPFAPALARGLGTDISQIYNLITLRNFTGFLAPLFGALPERFGRKPTILVSAFLFSVGCFLVVVWPTIWMLGASLIIIAVMKTIFDPSMHAYLGDVVPYAQRGRAVGIVEMSWAGGLLIGAPVVSLAIARQGWLAPFAWLAILGMIGTFILWRIMPTTPAKNRTTKLRDLMRVLRAEPLIWVASIYIMCVMGANELVFVIFGDWLETSFSLDLTQLGLAAGIIGGAELMGEIVITVAVDKVGKRPFVITSILFAAIIYLLLPFASNHLISALVTLFMVFFCFELTVVGSLPLFSELVPKARGLVLAFTAGFASLGRALGSLIGPAIWEQFGFLGNGIASGLVMLIALFLFSRYLKVDE